VGGLVFLVLSHLFAGWGFGPAGLAKYASPGALRVGEHLFYLM